jgi:hypothetical protein
VKQFCLARVFIVTACGRHTAFQNDMSHLGAAAGTAANAGLRSNLRYSLCLLTDEGNSKVYYSKIQRLTTEQLCLSGHTHKKKLHSQPRLMAEWAKDTPFKRRDHRSEFRSGMMVKSALLCNGTDPAKGRRRHIVNITGRSHRNLRYDEAVNYMIMKMTVFRGVAPRSLVDYRRLRGACSLHHQDGSPMMDYAAQQPVRQPWS